MSLKSIDAQLALSRAMEASSLQQQLNNKPTGDQTLLAAQTQKKAEEDRKKSAQVDRSDNALIHEDEGQSGGQQHSGEKRRKAGKGKPEDGADRSEHPYKGRHIDISL